MANIIYQLLTTRHRPLKKQTPPCKRREQKLRVLCYKRLSLLIHSHICFITLQIVPCFAYTNAGNRAKKRQGMKKDYRTSTNHEQWPRLLLYTSYYTIVWPHRAFVCPRQTIVWPQQTIVWSRQTIVWPQQTTIVCDRKTAVFRTINKKPPFIDLKTNDSANYDRYSLAISKSHYPTLCHV